MSKDFNTPWDITHDGQHTTVRDKEDIGILSVEHVNDATTARVRHAVQCVNACAADGPVMKALRSALIMVRRYDSETGQETSGYAEVADAIRALGG